MGTLTENTVLARTRAQDLNSVRKLNCWGCELTNIEIIRKMTNVEVLSLSVNGISTLEDFSYCKNLRELYIRKNDIQNLNEVIHLKDLPKLQNLWLEDNPCAIADNYRLSVLRVLPNLEKLDNINVNSEELDMARQYGYDLTASNELEPEEENIQQSPNESFSSTIQQLPEQQTEPPTPNFGSEEIIYESPSQPEATSCMQQAFQAKVQTMEDHTEASFQDLIQKPISSPDPEGLSDSILKSSYPRLDFGESPCQSSDSVKSLPGSARSTSRLLSKGGRNRNSNILSAVLCLIKELDYPSLEVIETAIHCRMEELEDN